MIGMKGHVNWDTLHRGEPLASMSVLGLYNSLWGSQVYPVHFRDVKTESPRH